MTFKDARPRLPFKGPIFMYAVFALGLAGASRFVDRQMERLHGAQGLKEAWVEHDLSTGGPGGLGPASGAELGAELAQYLPLASLDLAALGIPAPGAGAQLSRVDALAGSNLASGLSSGLVSGPATGPATGPFTGLIAGPDASDGAPEWTFLMTPEQRRAHRSPEAPHARLEVGVVSPSLGAVGHGAPPEARACALAFRLVDGAGSPLHLVSLKVTQQGSDGEVHPVAYRSPGDEGWWTGGSPTLTPGRCAHFEVEGAADDGTRWVGATLGRAPLRGCLDLGSIQLQRPAD